MHGTPSPIGLGLDVLDAEGGELGPQAVQVEAELAPGQHSAATAVPPIRVPSLIGRRPGPRYPDRPMASCTVATPSAASWSTTARSAREIPVTITGRISSACP